MTYTSVRYRSYQEYLDDEQLDEKGNYRLLSTGELIEVASEDDENLWLGDSALIGFVRTSRTQKISS